MNFFGNLCGLTLVSFWCWVGASGNSARSLLRNSNGSNPATPTLTGDAYNGNEITSDYAVAYFDENNIRGSVAVTKGHIFVYLNFSDFNFEEDWSENNGAKCLKGGLYWSIHETWTDDSNHDKIGATDCSVDLTGSRWDPWLACSPQSHNEYCDFYQNGCVPPFSYSTYGSEDDTIYYCSEYTYSSSPYACEVGDWSGKYGTLNNYDSNTKSIVAHFSSPYEVDAVDLSGKSILFRCGLDQSRALCAPFQQYTPSSGSGSGSSSNQDDNMLVDFSKEEYNRPYQNLTYSKIAYINDNSFVKLTYYQKYEISIDLSTLTIPGSCGDSIYYSIYTEFEGSSRTNCKGNVGSFYDPTITCNENTENEDKGYCSTGLKLCYDNNYEYLCEIEGYYMSKDRFLCGPGDLSNKYGSIDISDGASYWFNKTGYDSLMIPLKDLINDDGKSYKSIVLMCENNNQLIACAPFEDYTSDAGLGNHVSPDYDDINNDEDDDNDSNSSSSEDTFLGVSNTVVLVMLTLSILTLIPCIRAICKRRQDNHFKNGGMTKDGRARSPSLSYSGNRSHSNRSNRSNSFHDQAASIPAVAAAAAAAAQSSQHYRESTQSDIESQSGAATVVPPPSVTSAGTRQNTVGAITAFEATPAMTNNTMAATGSVTGSSRAYGHGGGGGAAANGHRQHRSRDSRRGGGRHHSRSHNRSRSRSQSRSSRRGPAVAAGVAGGGGAAAAGGVGNHMAPAATHHGYSRSNSHHREARRRSRSVSRSKSRSELSHSGHNKEHSSPYLQNVNSNTGTVINHDSDGGYGSDVRKSAIIPKGFKPTEYEYGNNGSDFHIRTKSNHTRQNGGSRSKSRQGPLTNGDATGNVRIDHGYHHSNISNGKGVQHGQNFSRSVSRTQN